MQEKPQDNLTRENCKLLAEHHYPTTPQVLFIDGVASERSIQGYKSITLSQAIARYTPREIHFVIAETDLSARERIYEEIKSSGYNLATLIHPSIILGRDSLVGEGCVINKFCHISSYVTLESNVFLSPFVIAQSHCVITQHSVIKPHSIIQDKNPESLYVIGTGGFAAEVSEYIQQENAFGISGYFDSINASNHQKYGFKAPFLGNEKEYAFDNANVLIAIGNQNVRERIYKSLKDKGARFPSFISQKANVSRHAFIGEGAVICPFVCITSNVIIGNNFQANIYSYVAHDCVLGENITLCPGVKINGNVHIGNNVFIGAGAIIHPGKNTRPLVIGNNVTIAAGSVVTKSIQPNLTVFGSPAVEMTLENIKRRMR
ncbi:MAG: NeuD/PglB/VioB family sugar acetyltransferase [Helicobacter sp.]|nr:NeuD/PglB/VioB family sugar acetyltransferase [Helicobacter sp.]MDY5741162.1 NeuD/PglB/VioB family sugar acetyltransferase [Helicobacter sp.]